MILILLIGLFALLWFAGLYIGAVILMGLLHLLAIALGGMWIVALGFWPCLVIAAILTMFLPNNK